MRASSATATCCVVFHYEIANMNSCTESDMEHSVWVLFEKARSTVVNHSSRAFNWHQAARLRLLEIHDNVEARKVLGVKRSNTILNFFPVVHFWGAAWAVSVEFKKLIHLKVVFSVISGLSNGNEVGFLMILQIELHCEKLSVRALGLNLRKSIDPQKSVVVATFIARSNWWHHTVSLLVVSNSGWLYFHFIDTI